MKTVMAAGLGAMLGACATLPAVPPTLETTPVASRHDAADDPALWIDMHTPENSRILGTDKQAGLYVYTLRGEVAQFLDSGRLNNVDVRQGVTIAGWTGDIASASNRSDDTVVMFTIADGVVEEAGRFASAVAEPYGLCLGVIAAAPYVFVTYKSGDIIVHRLTSSSTAAETARLAFDSQLEGCVVDDRTGVVYVGEEEHGVWATRFDGAAFSTPQLIDGTRGRGGLVADVEGLALYHRDHDGATLLIVSSQGNNSFVVYDLRIRTPVGRFRIAANTGVDGVQETDGVEAASHSLGDAFPAGVLVVQDGRNHPRGETQNYKVIDWRDVEAVLSTRPVTQN